MTEPVVLFGSAASASPSPRTRAAVLHELRHLLPMHEGCCRQVLPFGLTAIDGCLPAGGLACGALHEVVADTASALPAAFGFVVAIVAQLFSPPPERRRSMAEGHQAGVGDDRNDPSLDRLRRSIPPLSGEGKNQIVFILPRYGQRRHGRLSGHGLNSLGLDPARAILVETAHRKDTLWALAEALRSASPFAVVGLIDRLDLKLSQKLQLAATDAGLPLLLLRPAHTLEASAAATRWRVGTMAAARDRFGLHARVRWHVQLERCRNGRPGEWVVEYDHVTHCFSLAAALADLAVSRSAGGRALRQAGRS